MSIIDKELRAKFDKINSREQSYRASQEYSDDEPTSFNSSTYSSINEQTIKSINSNSSLSHSSSNASSNSLPSMRKQTQSLTNKNLKNQFLNSINHQAEFNHFRNNNFLQNDLKNRNSQINSSKSTSSICVNNHQNGKPGLRRSSAVVEHSLSIEQIDENEENDHQIENLSNENLTENTEKIYQNPRSTVDLTENLNNSAIEPIDLNNLANLAKLSQNSDSNLSIQDSNASNQSDSNLSTNSDLNDKEEDNKVKINQFSNIKLNPFVQQDHKIKNLFKAAKEIRDSEKTYVDILTLICVKYRDYVQKSISVTVLDQLLQPFSIILQLNTVLLTRFNHCIKNWDRTPKIAGVLVELGPFLKHYGDFATKFEQINGNYNEIKKKYPAFKLATEEFEKLPECKHLTIAHYFLKPIQRIPQYKLLIEKYLKYLKNDSRHPDFENAVKALKEVSLAAEYTNEKMRESENFAKLLNIQQCISGGYVLIKPHRRLIKKDVLFKISRKVKQERLFILCNDCLVYLTILKEGSYKVNHELPLNGMRISSPDQDDFMNEILIRSSQRSIRVIASTVEQKQEWMDAIQQQIRANMRRRSTLKDPTTLFKELEFSENRELSLGEEAPIWTPDSRVSMCQRCSSDFSITNRRHHCRACGKVVCSKCSKQTHYLAYLRRKQRVCDDCFQELTKHAIPEQDENNPENHDQNGLEHQSKHSSSDPQLNNHSKSMEDALSDYKKIYAKVRRNSSNLTGLGTMSNRSSIQFADEDEYDREKDRHNDDIISSLLESRPNSINRSSSILTNGTSNENNNQSNNQVNGEKSNQNENSIPAEEPMIIPTVPSTPQPSTVAEQPFNRNLNLRQSGRRRVPKVLTEISANDTDSDMSGYMNKKKGKKQWRKQWFVLKNHVLYSFKQSEDIVATESMPVLGYTVHLDQESLTLQLTHQNQPDIYFLCTEKCIEKWFKALSSAATIINGDEKVSS